MTEKKPSYITLREKASPLDISAAVVPDDALRAFHIAMGQYIMRDAQGLWLEPESRDGHCDPEKLCVTLGTRIGALSDLYSDSVVGSPIEGQLIAALLWLDIDWAGHPEIDRCGAFKGDQIAPTGTVLFFLTPQAEVAGYKADIALWFQCGRERGGLVIECDGHQFHEKTKEQAARDKARDRAMLTAGYPVMRFSGSEIFRDPVACVEQVREIACEILFRVSKDGGLF